MRFLIFLIFFCACEAIQDQSVYLEFEGSNIYYQSIGKGETTLVFIHGWGCDMKAWQNQKAYFEDHLHVVLIDLPGFGMSSKNKVDYNIEYFSNGIQAVIHELALSKVILVGHSLGTPIAKKIAEAIPELITGICVIDGVYFDFPEDPAEIAAYKKELQGFVSMFKGEDRIKNTEAFINSLHVEATSKKVRNYAQSTMSKVPEFVGHTVMQNLVEEKNWKKESVAIPTLAIYANIPELPENNDSILRIWYPNLTYIEMDTVGHFLMMEQPDEFNRLLHDFISEIE